jgi:hypothetical protein
VKMLERFFDVSLAGTTSGIIMQCKMLKFGVKYVEFTHTNSVMYKTKVVPVQATNAHVGERGREGSAAPLILNLST